MAENSGFFRSVNGDRKYSVSFLAKWAGCFVSNGVYNGELAVTAGENMQIVVPAGRAWLGPNGERYKYENDSDKALPIANADGVLARKDTVVLRWDVNERSITAQVLAGEFSSNPVAPAISRTAEQYDLKLAEIHIAPGATAITQAVITDTRLDSAVCGIVTSIVTQVDTSTFYNQIQSDLAQFRSKNQAEFTAWFQSIRDVLDESAAGNLLNMIQTHEADTVTHVTQEDHDKINGAVQGNTKAWVATEVAMADNNYAFQLSIPNFVFSEGCQVTFKAPAAPIDSYFSYVSISGVQYSLRTLSQNAITSEAWKANTTVTVSLSTIQINLGDNGRSGTAFFSGASTVQSHNTSQGKLTVSIAAYDGGSIGNTKVRMQNASLGMDLSYAPDALGKVSVQLVGNKTYSISLIDVPEPYYGEATSQYIGFDTENSLSLQLKDQPDIIGVQINMATGETTYTDGAADWVPMSMNGETLEVGSWENSWLVKDIRPCLLKDGVVQYYLKKTGFMQFDYSLKEDGSPSDITSGNDGDVMIEIPRFYTEAKMVTVLDVEYLSLRFSKEKAYGNFRAEDFFGSPIRDSLYIAAYRGYSVDATSPLLSLSGKAPTQITAPSDYNNEPMVFLNHGITTRYQGLASIASVDVDLLYELYIMLFCTHVMNAYGWDVNGITATGIYNNKPLCYMKSGAFKFLGIEHPFSGYTCPGYNGWGQRNDYNGASADRNSQVKWGMASMYSDDGVQLSSVTYYLENFHTNGSTIMPEITALKTLPSTGKMGVVLKSAGASDSGYITYSLWTMGGTENIPQLCLDTSKIYMRFRGSTSAYSYWSYTAYRHFKFLEPLS